MDVGSDVRVHADQFEHVLMVVDVLQHGERRTVGHHGHGFGELAVAFGDLLVAQVVRVFDVVLELAFRVGGVVGAVGGRRVLPQSCVRPCRRHVGQVVEHSKLARVGSGGQQGHAEFLVLVRGGHEFVATRVDAGRDSQHDAGALAEPLGDRGDACRLIRLVNHDFVEALFDGQFDFRVGLVVAVQHEAAAWDARGERDAHLTHGAGVDEHAGFGDDAADFLAQQRFAGEADVGDGVVERVGGRMHEFRGAVTHLIGVDDVERRAEFVEQAFAGAAVEGDLAFGVHGRSGRPDWTHRHGLRYLLPVTSCRGR